MLISLFMPTTDGCGSAWLSSACSRTGRRSMLSAAIWDSATCAPRVKASPNSAFGPLIGNSEPMT